jgi:hypothetical protein
VGRHRRPCPCRQPSLPDERPSHKRPSSPGGGTGDCRSSAVAAVRRCGGAAVRRCGGAAARRRGGAAARTTITRHTPCMPGGVRIFVSLSGGRPGAPQSGSEKGRKGADPPTIGRVAHRRRPHRAPGVRSPSGTGGWRLCAPVRRQRVVRCSLSSRADRRPRQPGHASRQARREPGRAAPHAVRNDHNFATPRLPAGGREETGAQSAPTVQPPAIKRGVGNLWRSPGRAPLAALPWPRSPGHAPLAALPWPRSPG